MLKIKFIYKFNDGASAESEPIDVYDLPKDNDWLKDVINGKLDNTVFASHEQHRVDYKNMSSIEIVFIEQQ